MILIKIFFSLVVLVIFLGCGDDDSTSVVNTNEYNVQAIATTELNMNLNLVYSTGLTGTMSFSTVYTGDSFVNGIPVQNIRESATLVGSETTASTSIDVKYDSNGIALELVDSDGVICTLQNTPTPLPITGKVGDSSTVSGEYACTDGTSSTKKWSLLDAGNGNAYMIFTITDYDSANNIEFISKEKLTLNASSVVTYYNIDMDLVSLGVTATGSGTVQYQ